jgi:hypothetical protein
MHPLTLTRAHASTGDRTRKSPENHQKFTRKSPEIHQKITHTHTHPPSDDTCNFILLSTTVKTHEVAYTTKALHRTLAGCEPSFYSGRSLIAFFIAVCGALLLSCDAMCAELSV